MSTDDLNEVHVPAEAIAAAQQALSGGDPALNSSHEHRWNAAVWRAAIKRALALPPKGEPWQPPIGMPAMKFFRDIETGREFAVVASRVATWTLEDRAYARSIDPASIPAEKRDALMIRALDDEIRRSGL